MGPTLPLSPSLLEGRGNKRGWVKKSGRAATCCDSTGVCAISIETTESENCGNASTEIEVIIG